MPWEKRGNKSYFYRNKRQNGRAIKVYFGGGEMGNLAAGADALRRAEVSVAKASRKAWKVRLALAVSESRNLEQVAGLLTDATLLASGFHRHARHKWRKWQNGTKTLTTASQSDIGGIAATGDAVDQTRASA